MLIQAVRLEGASPENPSRREHFGVKRLADEAVWIEARRVKGRVIALVESGSARTNL